MRQTLAQLTRTTARLPPVLFASLDPIHMRILAVLPPDSRRRFEHSLAPVHYLLPEQDISAATRALTDGVSDALVIDPTVIPDPAFEALIAAMTVRPTPVLVYTPLSTVGARRVVRIAELGPHELVLRDFDDSPDELRRKVPALVRPSVSAMLLSSVAPQLRGLPERLQIATVRLFSAGQRVRWVDELAESAQLGRRTIDRWMSRAGLNGSAMLLDTTRLAQVWEPIVEQKRRPSDVASAYGYSRLRLLVSHTRRIAGVLPAELGTMSREQFAVRLSGALTTR